MGQCVSFLSVRHCQSLTFPTQVNIVFRHLGLLVYAHLGGKSLSAQCFTDKELKCLSEMNMTGDN